VPRERQGVGYLYLPSFLEKLSERYCRVVIRYSGTHEKDLPNRLVRAEWGVCIEPHIPTPKGAGRPRLHPLREVHNAIFYIFWLRIPTNGLGGPFLRLLYTHLLPHL
jgi:hypothetical protein